MEGRIKKKANWSVQPPPCFALEEERHARYPIGSEATKDPLGGFCWLGSEATPWATPTPCIAP